MKKEKLNKKYEYKELLRLRLRDKVSFFVNLWQIDVKLLTIYLKSRTINLDVVLYIVNIDYILTEVLRGLLLIE